MYRRDSKLSRTFLKHCAFYKPGISGVKSIGNLPNATVQQSLLFLPTGSILATGSSFCRGSHLYGSWQKKQELAKFNSEWWHFFLHSLHMASYVHGDIIAVTISEKQSCFSDIIRQVVLNIRAITHMLYRLTWFPTSRYTTKPTTVLKLSTRYDW